MRSPQERDHISWVGIALAAVTVTVVSAAFILIAWGIDASGPPRGQPTPWARTIPEETNEVEVAPFDEPTAAERSHISARKRLSEYGWVDREAGVAYIPIGTAAEIYMARIRREAQ